jgi:acetyl-CoA synthetase
MKIKNKKKPKIRRKASKKSKARKKPKIRRKTSKKPKIKKNTKEKSLNKELIFKTKPEWIKNALVNKTKYQNKYSDSIKNNNEFWKKEGKRITWIKPYKKIKNVKYSKTDVQIKLYRQTS